MAEIPIPTTGYSAPSGDRPLGVTILAILQILGGFLGLLAASIFFIVPFWGWIIGGFLAIFALLDVVIGWGLWSMKSWAWMVAIILNIIGIIIGIPTADWLGIIISIIVILYLQQPDIKSRFR